MYLNTRQEVRTYWESGVVANLLLPFHHISLYPIIPNSSQTSHHCTRLSSQLSYAQPKCRLFMGNHFGRVSHLCWFMRKAMTQPARTPATSETYIYKLYNPIDFNPTISARAVFPQSGHSCAGKKQFFLNFPHSSK